MKPHLKALSALALAAALCAVIPAQAQTTTSSVHAGSLEVPLNKSQVVTADRPIAKALVGSSDIADVLPISDRSIYVLGKRLGTTSLTLYDHSNRVLAIMDIEVGPDVESLRRQLALLIPGQTVDARISNDSIILSGMVSNPGAADRAAQIAKAYAGDKVINLIAMGGSQQVMLEVRFAEVNRNFNRDLGVRSSATSKNGSFGGVSGTGSQFQAGTTTSGTTTSNTSNGSLSNNSTNSSNNSSNNTATNSTNLTQSGTTGQYSGPAADFTNIGNLASKTFSGTGGAGSDATASSTTSGSTAGTAVTAIGGAIVGTVASATSSLSSALQMGSIGDGFGIFRQRFSIGNLAIESVLNAMESRGLAKTLAEPTLLALSGEKASFLAGGEFPIPVAQTNGSGGGSSISVEFKSFGVSLAFTPTVLADGVINLIVEPEVSSLDPGASVTIGGLVIPGLRTRRASTTIELRDGESFAIAGLLQKDYQTTVRQLPLLGSIPILGALFRSSGFQKGETELLIVVTPRLVSPVRPDQIRLPTDGIDDPNENDVFFKGEGYRRKALAPMPNSAAPRSDGKTSMAPPQDSVPGQLPATSASELSPVAQSATTAASGPTPKEQGYAY